MRRQVPAWRRAAYAIPWRGAPRAPVRRGQTANRAAGQSAERGAPEALTSADRAVALPDLRRQVRWLADLSARVACFPGGSAA